MSQENPKQVSIWREFIVSVPLTAEWFEKTIIHISSLCNPSIYFSGSYEIHYNTRNNVREEDQNEWLKDILQQWSLVRNSNASFRSDVLYLGFNCDHQKSSLQLNVQSISLEEGNRILTDLGTHLQLIPVEEQEKQPFSVRMRFFTPEPITPQWFEEEAIKYLVSLSTPLIYFHGSYDLGSYFYGDTIGTETVNEWFSDIKQKWLEVTNSEATFRSDNRGLSFRCDHRRSLIDLEVRSSSQEKNSIFLSEIEKHLHLSQVKEDPYRYRKSAATYKVNHWKKTDFVEATGVLMKELFKEQEPAVLNAYITTILDNKIEKLQGFNSVKRFLDYIDKSDESAFEQANIYVEGANGLAVGVSLNKKDKRLVFKSNIPPGELDERVAKPYKEPLTLELIKGEPDGYGMATTTQPKEEKWWVKYAIQIGVALLALIGTTAVVVMSLARSYLTEYDLKITNPSQSQVVIDSPQISLSWYLWPKDVFLSSADYKPRASIIIVHNEQMIGEFKNSVPPFNIQLHAGEGKYIVEVRPEKKAQPTTLIITFKKHGADIQSEP